MTSSSASPVRCTHARIEGRVQGVWYRAWTVREASRLGLRGWVRNRQDGTVEAVFCGPPEVVDAMVAACHKGPPAAMVTNIRLKTGDDPGGSGFRELATV